VYGHCHIHREPLLRHTLNPSLGCPFGSSLKIIA
jgi:hypothetical protein